MRPSFLALAGLALSAAPLAADPAQRVVAAGGDLTEIVYALGEESRLVGVDSTSGWPADAETLPQIGYVRRLSAEGVLSLAPDLMIASDDAGPEDVLAVLREAGLEIASAPRAEGLDEVADKIRFVGEALDAAAAGDALAEDYTRRLAAARAEVSRMERAPRVLFILSTRGGAPMVGGSETSAAAMIEAADGVNVAARIAGYKPMNAEAIIAAAPEVILMTTAHSDRLGGLEEVMARPDIALTPAGKAGRGAELDALLLLGMGPRAPEAITRLAAAIRTGPMEEAGSGG